MQFNYLFWRSTAAGAIATVLLTVFVANRLPETSIDRESLLEATKIMVNAQETQFDTPSPTDFQVVDSHPRIMFRKSEIASLKEKLLHPEYKSSLAFLRKDRSAGTGATSAGLLYAIFDDAEAFGRAKNRLLSCDFRKWNWPYYDNQWVFVWACVYDWLSDGLTKAEKEQAWAAFREKASAELNIAAFEKRGEFQKEFETNHNDAWGKLAAPYEGIVALAIYDDGVADEWAKWTIDKILKQHRSFCTPWGKHGMIDWTNLMALDTGGSQAETAHTNTAGYIGFYAGPTMLMTGAWDSATNQDIWSQTNFFRYWPHWNTYDNETPLSASELGLGIMEVVAGRFQKIDPDMSSLAAWYLDQYGRSETAANLIPAIIWGDRRIKAKSPGDLEMPKAKFLRGADVCVSRDNWEKTGTIVAMRSRYIDTLRFEGDSGCTWIYRNHEPILVRPRTGKWRDTAANCSGLGFRNPKIKKERLGTKRGAGATYWGAPPGRVKNASDAANLAGYFPDCLAKEVHKPTYSLFSTQFQQLYLFDGVDFAQRTLVHFPDRQLVILVDQFEIDPGIEYYSTIRLPVAPQISGQEIIWNDSSATVLAFDGTQPSWIGGEKEELLAPWGKWLGARKYKSGYSSVPEKKRRFGEGTVWTYGQGTNTIVTAISLDSKVAPKLKQTATGVDVAGIQIRCDKREVNVDSE